MRPEITELLRTTALQLPGMVAPTPYALGTAGLMTGLLMISAQHYDRAAEIRVADNQEMRALFAELAPTVNNVVLRGRLEAAAGTSDASIRISLLNAANAELRKLLITLQAYLEVEHDKSGQKRVWDVLKASADRRMLSTAMG